MSVVRRKQISGIDLYHVDQLIPHGLFPDFPDQTYPLPSLFISHWLARVFEPHRRSHFVLQILYLCLPKHERIKKLFKIKSFIKNRFFYFFFHEQKVGGFPEFALVSDGPHLNAILTKKQ